VRAPALAAPRRAAQLNADWADTAQAQLGWRGEQHRFCEHGNNIVHRVVPRSPLVNASPAPPH